MKRTAVLTILSLAAAGAHASDDIQHAMAESRSGLWQIASLSFANPAVNQWRMDCGITEVGGTYNALTHKDNPDPREGDGAHELSFEASTYTKYRTSTLWGTASYVNGRTRNVVWNETSDSRLLYPYLMADSVGGDLSREQYSFSGGYADHRRRWAWGAEMSYVAGLHYRSIDPRPKNVTGCLDIAAGAMLRFAGNYYAGIAINARKYKQTNDIEFKSEMGVDKIFHLTGLANHYNRFAGTGLSAYYDGYRYGADLNIYPSDSRGFFAACRLSRFTFKNILSDLNKLPLASVWHNELQAQGGWMSGEGRMEGGASGAVCVYRRHGTENVFGDAASGIYPVIGSNEMYADNAVEASATARWGMRFGPVNRFHVSLTPGWMHRTTAYIEPYSYKVVNRYSLAGAVAGTLQIAGSWLIHADIRASFGRPYSCTLSMAEPDGELRGLADAERGAYRLESARTATSGAALAASRTIGKRYAVSIAGSWDTTHYSGVTTLHNYNLKISFIF